MNTRRILTSLAVVIPIAALMAAGPILAPRSGPDDLASAGVTSQPGRQLTLSFTNDTGVEADGLQIEFKRAPSSLQLLKSEPFRSITPVLKSNVVIFSNGRVRPNEKAQLTVIADAFGVTVKDYQWIRQGVLIAGSARQVEIEERVISRETVAVGAVSDEPEPTLVTVRFEMANGTSRLFATQGMMVAEGALLAIKDQIKFEALMNEIARTKNAKERERLQAELKKLEVRSPISGLVHTLTFDVGDETTKVEAKLLLVAPTLR
ncbi:MAG: hypothetical protein NZ610_07390 [Candidatus Bipolaricaulota bacterium]|nr:hypothetical protein [Candidatus Bipolaricaulota bacterium]MCS7275203.1 hypothetical protein [Candidatus Bipolaricaulota bacterium]MDW8111402.1 hypothetical protein [Candidatus Bipolaricaulota bacterium]MDW8329657.1 hypothetical protein [Candidatus Bipolaricaulota bacterium]